MIGVNIHIGFYTHLPLKLHVLIALFDGGSYWKLHLLRYGLILYILLGILMTAVLMVSRLLSRQTRVSLRLFLIHVTHSFFLIGYLTLILTYPGTVSY